MANNQFDFKQFSVRQERCAMKVGTDGVLLGAWANGGRRILDIGAGTGLVSLMMAQRYKDAVVDAVEIDADAAEEAGENVAASPFAARVKVVNDSIQSFALHAAEGAYDSIVSNPPFFVQSLKNPDSKRAMARHSDSLPFADLVHACCKLLSQEGVFSVIVPAEQLEPFLAECCLSGLFLSRRCAVKTTERKPAKRYLLEFAKRHPAIFEDRVEVLSCAGLKRSPWYQKITDDFYIF